MNVAVRRGLILYAGAVLLLHAAKAQQQPPAPVERPSGAAMDTAPTLHVESRLVSIALNVVDEHGAPVSGIKADDLELSEDGKPVPIANFDAESSTPLEIVLAIDASGSVWSDERLERDAAKSFVRSLLRPQDRIDLMDFSDNVDELVAFTNDAKQIDDALPQIKRGDATALYDAVYLASERLAEVKSAPGARRVVVVISDGDNTTRHGSYDMAVDQAQRAGAMVYALIVVPILADAGRDTGGEHALIQMTRDTGGKYYYVEDKRDLAPAFAHVSEDLRTQYTVGYYAPRKAFGDGDLRHILLQMKDPALRGKYTLRYRTSYYATR